MLGAVASFLVVLVECWIRIQADPDFIKVWIRIRFKRPAPNLLELSTYDDFIKITQNEKRVEYNQGQAYSFFTGSFFS